MENRNEKHSIKITAQSGREMVVDHGNENEDRCEAVERLIEIKEEMRELVNEAMQIVRDQVGYDDVRYSRAERYWSGHIVGALGARDDSFSGRSMFTLQETIDELDETGCGNCGGELDDPDYELCSDCR